MRYTFKNTDRARTFEVVTKKEILQVLEVDTALNIVIVWVDAVNNKTIYFNTDDITNVQ